VLDNEWDRELEVQGDDGRWYRLNIRVRRDGDGTVRGTSLTIVDIQTLTERVNEARRAAADAEALSRTKDEFLSVLSHELRTPLASVLMHAQLLRQGQLDAPAVARTLQAIERGARRQVQLIDDLLDASRIIANKLTLENRAFDLCSVVRAALDGVADQGRRKSVTVEALIDDSIGQVWGDPSRIQKVTSNLLTNAIKFTPPGGLVQLELKIDDGSARLTVSDNGVGIAPDFLPHVFDRLLQEDSSITREHGGLGLGLAIVRHIVELLGGSVHAHSGGLGHGASFTVTFPLTGFGRAERDVLHDARAPQPLDRPGYVQDYLELRDLPVLIVDDDPATLDAIVTVLRLSGADVRAAPSAAAATRMLETFDPKVLVCDIAMPGEDGHAFIRKLRDSDTERGSDVRALALTALSGEEDRRRALAAGFHAHMAKPVDVDRLRDAVVELLRV
jgi:signal transduction histidine kinase/CheY-like chemotaxis protein